MALYLSEKSHKNPMASNVIWSFIPGNDPFGLLLPFKWFYWSSLFLQNTSMLCASAYRWITSLRKLQILTECWFRINFYILIDMDWRGLKLDITTWTTKSSMQIASINSSVWGLESYYSFLKAIAVDGWQ